MFISPDIENKLIRIFWDMPPEKRNNLKNQILANVHEIILEPTISRRLLMGLNWWDLMFLFDKKVLLSLLDDSIIDNLYPGDLQIKYKNARRLLSKYSLPTAR